MTSLEAPRRLFDYSAGLVLTLLAAAIRAAFPAFFAPIPFMPFFLVIALSAWRGGWNAGVFATTLSASVHIALSEQTRFGAESLLRVVAFVAVGAAISAIAEALHRSARERSYLASIIDSTWDGVVGKTLDGSILSWNRGAERIYGYTAQEAVGRNIDLVTPPEGRAELRALLDRIGRGEEVQSVSVERVRKDGERRVISLSLSPVRDGSGAVIGASGIDRDITEQRRAERALAESESRFRILADNAPVMVWMARPDQGCDWFSRAWLSFRGRSLEQESGSGWSQGVHPDDRDRCLAARRAAFESAEPFEIEYRLRHASGEFRWVLERGVPRRQGDTLAGYIGSCSDIHERKSMEDALRFLSEASAVLASSLDYKATLASVARLAVPRIADWCVVDMVEDDGGLRRLAVAHTDPAKVELAYELHRRFPTPADAPHGPYHVLRTGEPELVPEIPDSMLVASAQSKHHLAILRELGLRSYLCVPLKVAGDARGVITFVTAESGRRYSKQDLLFAEGLAARGAMAVENARLYSDLREAGRRKDEFLATLSHELRSPLNAVVGWASILRTGDIDEATRERALDSINRSALLQTQLINDILDVQRLSAGKLRLSLQEVDLQAVIGQALDTVQPAAHAKGIRLVPILDSDTGVVSADPDRLQQVVWNLLSNAIKFTPKGGRVEVRLLRVNSHVEITVEDSGPGIEPSFLPYIFERFRQADSSSTRRHGGVGLGLSIVRSLVELHGGTVSAANRTTGRGAAFVVRLPRMAVAPGAPAIAGMPRRSPTSERDVSLSAAPSLHGVHVIVVDDDPEARELVAVILERCGAEVTVAKSTGEAVELVVKERPDVLICDIEMPDEDGYALIRRIRALPDEQGGRTPAAALTAYAGAEDRIRALSAGFQMHVPKPVQPVELAIVVASLAERGRRPSPSETAGR
jgi:PAS domain S-box-containing protein